MLWSELARSAVHKAAELSDPGAPGPSELLAVICDLSGGAGAEAEGLSTLLRSMGVEASTLRQLALAEPRTEETLHTVLSCAARFQEIEGAVAITCRHLLLAVLQRPTPELQQKLAAVLMPPDVLFTKTLVMGAVGEAAARRRRVPAGRRNMVDSYRGHILDGRYRVLDGAQGGMGCVLFCLDPQTRQAVALKLCADTAPPELFIAEGRKWILLGAHPYIVRALYAGKFVDPVREEVPREPSRAPPPIRYLVPIEGSAIEEELPQLPDPPPPKVRVYLVLEMIAKSSQTGSSLRHWLDDTARIPSQALLRWAFQIAGAMEYASTKHGLIHQDIKPDNILITSSGDAKLTDFGVASVAGKEMVRGGTPVYMAPEHRAGHPSVQSDIYSFGITLAESFLGHVRPGYLALIRDGQLGAISESQLAILLQDGRPADEPRAMALCQALARIIKICTNPDPAKRFAGFGVLRALLAQAAHTHLGMKLEGTAGLEPSAADLTNQAIGLLQLQPGRSEGRRAIELLLQAILKSPDDLVALSWLRRQVATMNSRQILRLALYHCKHGMRTRRWWSRPLAGAALFAVLVFCSAEPWLIKLSAAALAALLAVEAYVSNLSLKKLNLFVYATAIVCALLYLLRRFGLPDDSQAWNLTGRGIWASLILCGFYWRGYRGLQREGRDVPSLRFAGLILPIVIFLGSARGFLFLVSYPLVTLLLWVILAYRNDWYVRSRRKQGIYRGQLWNRPLLETPPPTSQATIMVVVIIMLYGTIVVDYVHRH